MKDISLTQSLVEEPLLAFQVLIYLLLFYFYILFFIFHFFYWQMGILGHLFSYGFPDLKGCALMISGCWDIVSQCYEEDVIEDVGM